MGNVVFHIRCVASLIRWSLPTSEMERPSGYFHTARAGTIWNSMLHSLSGKQHEMTPMLQPGNMDPLKGFSDPQWSSPPLCGHKARLARERSNHMELPRCLTNMVGCCKEFGCFWQMPACSNCLTLQENLPSTTLIMRSQIKSRDFSSRDELG